MSKLFNKQNFNAAKEFVSTIKNKLNKKDSTISSVKPGTNLTKKRKVQDNVVSDKDKAMKNLDAEGKLSVRTKVPLKKTNKEVSDILDKKK